MVARRSLTALVATLFLALPGCRDQSPAPSNPDVRQASAVSTSSKPHYTQISGPPRIVSSVNYQDAAYVSLTIWYNGESLPAVSRNTINPREAALMIAEIGDESIDGDSEHVTLTGYFHLRSPEIQSLYTGQLLLKEEHLM